MTDKIIELKEKRNITIFDILSYLFQREVNYSVLLLIFQDYVEIYNVNSLDDIKSSVFTDKLQKEYMPYISIRLKDMDYCKLFYWSNYRLKW